MPTSPSANVSLGTSTGTNAVSAQNGQQQTIISRFKHNELFKRKPLDSEDQLAEHLSQISLSDPVPVSKFEEMNLKPTLLKGIQEYGSGLWKQPALCQQRVIMPIIQGRDVLCQAQSGMGKTAAFCIGLLQRIDPLNPKCQVLVLAPTHELAVQINGVFIALGKYMGIKTLRCDGGGSYLRNNIDRLKSRTHPVHIVIGTLGRIYSLLRRDALDGNSLKTLVIDEADKMISDRSFRKDMEHIIKTVSATAQIIVMSATMPSYEIKRTESFMRNPYQVLVRSDQLTLDGIQQFYVNVEHESNKLENMSEIYPFVNKASGIVFCNTRKKARWLNDKMQALQHNISGMVGTMEPVIRANTLSNFRTGAIAVLIASDLLGRGIDVDHVKLVINYDLPTRDDVTQYIHRVGRAGRYGKKGIAITFVTQKEMTWLAEIETYYHTSITPMPQNINQLVLEAAS